MASQQMKLRGCTVKMENMWTLINPVSVLDRYIIFNGVTCHVPKLVSYYFNNICVLMPRLCN